MSAHVTSSTCRNGALSALYLYLGATVLALLICSVSFAQVQTGTISGTVKDNSGAVIPDAKITLKSLDTGATRTAVTGSQGSYTIPGLQPGNYELTAPAANFSNYKQNVQVTVGGFESVDATLGLAAASTTVEVTA